MDLLTLEQIAKEFKCSTKTFAKMVSERSIPFVPAGRRSKRFDLNEVIEHLKKSDASKAASPPAKRSKNTSPVRSRSEFSGILG